MEQDRMTFDTLWDEEERQGLQRRLRQGYPQWQRQRRQRRTALATVAVLAVTGISFFLFPLSDSSSYDAVCCNRSGIADGHWADVAAHVLTIETI